MTQAPELFRHVVIGSPALWSMHDAMTAALQTLLRGNGPKPARMFVGVSAGDWPPIRESATALVQTLKAHAPAGVMWSSADFAHSTHQSSVAALVASALPWALSTK
jgi:predicted alpha/beta superfamily hydrolase